MSRHTPGPWVYEERLNMICGRGGGKGRVVVAGPPSVLGEFRPADARLISMAPELLAFAQTIVNTVFVAPDEPRLLNWKDAYKARAAEAAILIARAEGSG